MLGGIAGATCRWAVLHYGQTSGSWPWPTLGVNVVGCAVLGIVATQLPFAAARRAVLWRDGVGIGFCGGLTTFSTLAVELAQMLRDDRWALAGGYLGASVVTGWLGYELVRRLTHRRVRVSAEVRN
ncbi:MAG TPA: CrcB family protein [Acidimicrobiales bacterium]|jgi:CrcB protein